MSQIKLTYFNGRGRAEPIRLLLAHAKVPYNDNRIEMAEWPKIKPTTPFGKVPVLQEGDLVLTQSLVILKYVAQKFGYTGANAIEAIKIEEIVGVISDLNEAFSTKNWEADATRKAKLQTEFYSEKAPASLKKFEEILSKNGTFLVGKKLSYADILLVNLLSNLEGERPNILNAYPGLKKLNESVNGAPGIKEYLAKRPKTPF